MPLASILVQYFGRRIHDRFERIQASFSEISSQAQENYSGARLIRAFAREESQIGLFERLNRQYIAPRAATGAADGHAMAHARIHPRRVDDHHPAGRRPPGARPPHHGRPVRGIQHLHDHAHLAHHRRGMGDQHLSARNRLGEAHRRTAASQARDRRPRRRSCRLPRTPCCKGRSSSATSSFSYGETRRCLNDISLHIPAGSSLAIVGPTGSRQVHPRGPDLAAL